jgi:hypothetical protein
MKLRVLGKARIVEVYSVAVLLRGVFKGAP